jgi:oligosaccharyltransferase complex subunit beta
MVNSHSIFFDMLKSRGHLLTYLQAESPELSLKKFGDYLYDNLIFFAPSVEDLNTISFDDIQEFASSGGNILMAVHGQLSGTVREFAESCGIEFDARGSAVIDHFQNEPSVDPR